MQRTIALGISLAWLLLFVGCGNPQPHVDVATVEGTPIIPTPAKLFPQEGVLALSEISTIHCTTETLPEGYFLADVLAPFMPSKPEVISSGGMRSDGPVPGTIMLFLTNQHSNPEGYRVNIQPHGINLSGGSRQGLFWAIQTLTQLLPTKAQVEEPNRSGLAGLPCMKVQDEPRFPHRGLLLDCSRHFMDKEFVKQYISLLALYKMNVLHWHLVDDQGWRIEIKKYPRLTQVGAWRTEKDGTRYGGFYTQNDIREIVAWANLHHVQIIPEIELPGHSQAALAAYPHLSCTGGPIEVENEWGVFKEIYCAGNDSSLTFLKDVLNEVMPLFPGSPIHLGCDEVPTYRWENCPKCQQRIAQHGLHDSHALKSWFITQIANHLADSGRTAIAWDEITEGPMPENIIVQSWRGFEGAEHSIEQGHPTIVSPTSHAYFDYGLNSIDLEKVYQFSPIPESIAGPDMALVLGGECNMWSERAPQHKVDQKVFPRLLAMAEALWNPPHQRSYDAFLDKVYQHHPKLDELDVQYGYETVPVSLTAHPAMLYGQECIRVEVQSNVRFGQLHSLLHGDNPWQQEMKKQIRSGERTLSLVWPGVQKVTAWLSHTDRANSDTIELSVHPHAAMADSLKLQTHYNEWYAAGGSGALVDGVLGSTNFRDGHWQGYWGNNLEAVVDLGEQTEIHNIKSNYLQYGNAWLFIPQEVRYSVSTDGQNFTQLAVLKPAATAEYPDYQKRPEVFIETLSHQLSTSVSARYVKLEATNVGKCPSWHDAAGSDAWIFVDELIVNAFQEE